jgi:hypothetical protein
LKNIIILAALLLVMPEGCSPQQSSPPPPANAGESPEAHKTVGVDELMKNVDRYSGEITVLGVVSAVSDKGGRLSLIDYEEYKRCRVVTCSLLTLPVSWKGKMPIVMDVVQARGSVEEEGEKLVFVAESLEGTEP